MGSENPFTPPQPNLVKSASNLSLNSRQTTPQSQQPTPQSTLRRTISRNSLLDLKTLNADQMQIRQGSSPIQKNSKSAPQSRFNASTFSNFSDDSDDSNSNSDDESDDDESANSEAKSEANYGANSGALETSKPANNRRDFPQLLRSQSMNNVELLKETGPSEGQLAVESISGTATPHKLSHRGSRVTPVHGSAGVPAGVPVHSVSSSAHSVPGSAAGAPGASTANAVSAAEPGDTNAFKSLPTNTDDYHDDFDAKRAPDSRVDYFSHKWNEEEIADSWRYVINSRQDMANSARLENASWRMWAQAKNKLKTADPSTVNWLKDYDVTWLYGPLYHDQQATAGLPSESSGSQTSKQTQKLAETVHPPPQALPMDPLGPMATRPSPTQTQFSLPPKSILKKKSLAEIMLEDTHENCDPSQSAANYLRHHLYRPQPQGQSRQVVANILNRQYAQHPKRPAVSRQGSTTKFSRPASLLSLRSSSYQSSNGEKRVHFNDRVEQCMAVDPVTDHNNLNVNNNEDNKDSGSKGTHESNESRKVRTRFSSVYRLGGDDSEEEEDDDEDNDDEDDEDDEEDDDEDDEEYDEEDDDDDDDDDDNGGLFLGLRRPSTVNTFSKSQIITLLPATTLKYGDEETPAPATVLVGAPGSYRSSRRPGFNAQYNPHPVQTFEIVDSELVPLEFPHED